MKKKRGWSSPPSIHTTPSPTDTNRHTTTTTQTCCSGLKERIHILAKFIQINTHALLSSFISLSFSTQCLRALLLSFPLMSGKERENS
jgi:hypothetical protein